MMVPYTLRSRIILLVLIVAFPLVGLTVIHAIQQYQMNRKEIQQEALFIAESLAKNQDQYIESTRLLVATLAQLPEVRNHNIITCHVLFGDLYKNYPLYNYFLAVDSQGNVFCSSPPLPNFINYTNQRWFQQAMNTRSFSIGTYDYQETTQKATLSMAYPIVEGDHQISTIVVAGLSIGWMNQYVSNTPLSEGIELSIIDLNGKILGHFPEPKRWVGHTDLYQLLMPTIKTEKTNIARFVDSLGRTRLVGFAPVSHQVEGTYIIVSISQDLAFTNVYAILLRNLLILGTVTLFAIALAWFGGNRLIVQPILSLIATTKQLASGDLSVRTNMNYTSDEFGSLAQAIDHMVESLQQQSQEREKAELALRISEERHRLISNFITDYVYSGYQTLDGRLVTEWTSGAFEHISGYTVEEINANGGWTTLLYPDDLDIAQQVSQSVLNHHACVVEYRITNKRGEIRWLRDHIQPLPYDPQKYQAHIVGAIQDITEEKLIVEALHHARDAAEAATRAKTEFLANMSHEIRTPLNAIIGMTSILLDTPLNAEQQQCVEIARTSGNTLLTLVNDILDLSRMETGKFKLELYPFHVSTCIKATLDMVACAAKSKNLRLSCHIDEQIPPYLIGDAARLQQILVNLLNNGIKFTEQGEISVIAKKDENSTEKTTSNDQSSQTHFIMLHIIVHDTGIGIPIEQMSSLFDSFKQLDGSINRKYNGAGLGLAISKQLVELMGGSIWVESEEKKGSTFHIRLLLKEAEDGYPFEQYPQTLLQDKTETYNWKRDRSFSPLRILIAEDNIVNQKILLRLLDHLSYRADVVANGLEVLESLERQHYDVIFMDIQMPEMDGIETTAHIRATFPKDHQPHIIGLIAHMMNIKIDDCVSAGMNDCIHKPMRLDEIKTALQQVRVSNFYIPQTDVIIDVEVLQQFIATMRKNAPDFADKIIAIYLEDMPHKITTLEHALAQRDIHLFRCTISTFKSSSAQLGAGTITMLCKEMERMVKSNIIDDLDRLLNELKRECYRVSTILREWHTD